VVMNHSFPFLPLKAIESSGLKLEIDDRTNPTLTSLRKYFLIIVYISSRKKIISDTPSTIAIEYNKKTKPKVGHHGFGSEFRNC
jgi:hypothetical protein